MVHLFFAWNKSLSFWSTYLSAYCVRLVLALHWDSMFSSPHLQCWWTQETRKRKNRTKEEKSWFHISVTIVKIQSRVMLISFMPCRYETAYKDFKSWRKWIQHQGQRHKKALCCPQKHLGVKSMETLLTSLNEYCRKIGAKAGNSLSVSAFSMLQF